MKIRKVSGIFSFPIGAYNPYANEIIIDARLDEYPILKNAILEHEFQHRRIGRKVSLFSG